MTFSLQQLEEIVLVLENESEFYRQYTHKFSCYNNTYGKRRSIIGNWLVVASTPWTSPRIRTWPGWVGKHTVEDRDQIRRYFDERYKIPQDEINKYAHIPSVWVKSAYGPPPLAPGLQAFVRRVVNAGGAAKWLGAENKGGYTVGLAAYHGYTLRNSDMNSVLAALQIACREAVGDRPVKPKEMPVPEPNWKDELNAARERGATIQMLRDSGRWVDERTEGMTSSYDFSLDRSKYRIKPGTDPGAFPPPPFEYPAEWQGTQPTPQEPDMTKPIEITTVTYANGADISKMTNSEVFDLIAAEEAAIDKLKQIKAHPKKLVAEIAKRQAGVDALVAHLDKTEV